MGITPHLNEKRPHLIVGVALFDKPPNIAVVSNPENKAETFKVQIPIEAQQIKGRSKKVNLRLEIAP